MAQKFFLRDVVLMVSGACSACGDMLLARLDEAHEKPVRLPAQLERLFERHVKEKHSHQVNPHNPGK